MASKQFEQRGWYRSLTAALAAASALVLCAFTVRWPFGIGSPADVVILFFCLVGLRNFYFSALGMLIVLVQSRRGAAGPGGR